MNNYANNELYYVLRKAKDDKFDQNSYAKVVSSLELDSDPKNGFVNYKGQQAFIQNWGSKSKCETIEKMVKYELNHFGLGEDW